MDLFLKSNSTTTWETEATLEDELVVHTIKGGCAGVVIYKRGPEDRHLMVRMLVEDDGNWFLLEEGFSSAWITDIVQVWLAARGWLDTNAVPDRRYAKSGIGYMLEHDD